MNKFIALFCVLLLTACGGGGYRQAERVKAVSAPQASGPISRACLSSDRKARSPSLCGCIQAVANRNLSSADQRLAASFYNNPQRAQDIRQSDNPNHERFWRKYKAYASSAEGTCG